MLRHEDPGLQGSRPVIKNHTCLDYILHKKIGSVDHDHSLIIIIKHLP